MRKAGFVLLILFCFISLNKVRAASQDECAIWLCLPGGFPQGCAAAHAAMIHRIKKFKPPLPNFNSCSDSGNGSYVMGYEPYEPCKDHFELIDYSDGDTQRPAQCIYNYHYTYNQNKICTGNGITVSERNCYYAAVKRPKPYFIEMTVDGEYLGKFFYQ